MTTAAALSPIQFRVGDVVRQLRRKKEWTIAHLAKLADLNASTISAIERGANYRGDTVDQLAKALGVENADGLFRHAAQASGAVDPRRNRLLAAYATIVALALEGEEEEAVRELEQIAERLAYRRQLEAKLHDAGIPLPRALPAEPSTTLDRCRTCGHLLRSHHGNLCRKHGCGCGGFA